MEWYAIAALIASVVASVAGTVYNAKQTKKANEAQAEHDQAMAALNHRYREEEAATSFEREASYNQYEADVNKMEMAGLSPALMYGGSVGNSTPQISSVGSSQGSGSVNKTPNMSDFFGKLDPAEYAGQAIERMKARQMEKQTQANVDLQQQQIRESISRTLENQRNTAFKKNLETTMFQQEQQKLRQFALANDTADFELQFKRDTRALDIEAKQLGNKELESKIRLVDEEIKTEPVKRAKLAKEMQQIDAATQNYYANTELLQENLKNGQVGRIMKEFGLSARTLNPMLRNADILNSPYRTQMEGAKIALERAGFSEFEATNAVIYYMAENPKDVTPSVINGISRILSKK